MVMVPRLSSVTFILIMAGCDLSDTQLLVSNYRAQDDQSGLVWLVAVATLWVIRAVVTLNSYALPSLHQQRETSHHEGFFCSTL